MLGNDTDVDGPEPLFVSDVDDSLTIGLVTWASDGSFTYDPNGQFDYLEPGQEATDSWSYTASDGVCEVTETVTITITGVNHAPVLSGDGAFDGITKGDVDNTGNTVAEILGASMSDPDPGALEGMAIYAVTGSNGTWQYSTNGGVDWTDVGTVDVNNALLLEADDLVRFNPDGTSNVTATILYYAWDQTAGTAGAKVDASSRGGGTPFSTSGVTADIAVADAWGGILPGIVFADKVSEFDTRSIAVADLNGDGFLDAVEGNQHHYNFVYLGNETGDFSSVAGIAFGSNRITGVIEVADVDGDGNMDIIEANRNYTTTGGPNYVYYGDGTGDFSSAESYQIGSAFNWTQSLAVADVDDDGNMDIIEGNYDAYNGVGTLNYVYYGNGTRDYSTAETYQIGSGEYKTRSVTWADVDGDGNIDIIEGNSGELNYVYFGNGTRDFSSAVASQIGSGAYDTFAIAVATIDNDAYVDIIEGNYGEYNYVYYGDGTRDLSGTATSQIGSAAYSTISIVVTDVDDDGNIDIVEGGSGGNVYYGDGTRDLSSAVTSQFTTRSATSLAVGDVDNDNDLDIIQGRSGFNYVYYGDGTRDYSGSLDLAIGQSSGNATQSLSAADMDNDGYVDIIEGNSDDYSYVHYGDGTGDFSSVATDQFGERYDSTQAVSVADLDGDGYLDLVVGKRYSSEPNYVYYGDGTRSFSSAVPVQIGSGSYATYAIAVADVDNDGYLDIVKGNNGINYVFYGNGTRDFSSVVPVQIGSNSNTTYSIAVADVDDDGYLDIIEGKFGYNYIFYGNGSRDFSSTVPEQFGLSSGTTQFFTVTDVDADGYLDIIEANGGTGYSRVSYGHGTRNFASADWSQLGSGGYSVAVADVNGDGYLDIAQGVRQNYSESYNYLYYGNGTRDFSSPAPEQIGPEMFDTYAIVVADLNDDGHPDIVAGNNSWTYDGYPNYVYLSQAPNSAPDAVNDDYGTDEDTVLSVPADGVLGNDSDPDPLDTLSVSGMDLTGTDGAVTWDADGGFTYDPNGHFDYLVAGQEATDSWTYTASDGKGGEDVATVTITITGVNDAPVAVGFTETGYENTVLVIDGWSFTDAENDSASHVGVSALPVNGTLFVDANDNDTVDLNEAVTVFDSGDSATWISWADAVTNETVKLAPDADWDGTTYLTYQVRDTVGEWGTTADGRIKVYVEPEATFLKTLTGGTEGINPTEITEVNGRVLFFGSDPVHGKELWVYDPVSGTTELVKDIYPGSSDSTYGYDDIYVLDGTLFFRADDGSSGYELWKSDGTEAGTVRVKDINPGSSDGLGAYPDFVDIDGTLFFRADDGSSGYELWKTDGTEAGTVRVKDIRAGAGGSSPEDFVNVDGTLFFSAYGDVTNGRELWKSDGTEAGTALVKDINPGIYHGSPQNLTNVNGVVYFRADDGTSGEELWKTDGTEAGTVRVKDINPGASDSSIAYWMNVEGTLFFRANDGINGTELWKSDGTEAGTVLVKDIRPGSSSSDIVYTTNVDGTLFFRADDGSTGDELWKSDGTEAGTVRVKDIRPGSSNGDVNYLQNVDGTLFFSANDGTNGTELWKTDGTEAGTVRVKDINPGSGSGYPSYLANVDGTLFFRANDGSTGNELWKSDGTEAGTLLVENVVEGSDPIQPIEVNGTLFFQAYDETTGYELWKSDGTEAGTVLVKDINPGAGDSGIDYLTCVDGTLFFRADDGTTGFELWKSDGTEAGTVRVKDVNPGSSSGYPGNLIDVNGTLFFAASDGTNGPALWKSDGTEAGTVMVKDVNPATSGTYPASLTDVNGTLFFRADDGTNGEELWKSDGTEAGTVMVKDIRSGSNSSYIGSLANVNGTLYFSANDGVSGAELWKSDGTEAGTVMVRDIRSGSYSSSPSRLTNVNGTLFFTVYDPATGRELWKSDGTEAGTVMVKDIRPGSSDSSIEQLTDVNGTLFFSANDGTNGIELWQSDGTEAGTVMVKDIYAGGYSGLGYSSDLTISNGTLVFRANDPVNGYEIWESDGTEAGTVLLTEIVAGPGSSSPSDLLAVGNTLFFTAYDEDLGFALWVYDIANDAPVLSGDGAFAAVDEDTPDASNDGQTIGEILGSTVTDPDLGAVEGIAVVWADSGPYGSFEYTIDDGANWTPFSGLSGTTATLLADNATTRMRFSPAQDFNTEPPNMPPAIEYRAWDQTSGNNGQTGVDVVSPGQYGGETAFSFDLAHAEIQVTAVNDAPTISGSGMLPNIQQDVPDASNQGETVEYIFGPGLMDVDDPMAMGTIGVAVVGADNTYGDWQYSLAGDGSDWTALGSVSDLNAVLLSPTAKIRFVPDPGWSGDAQITVRAWDQTSGSVGDTGVDVSTNGGTTAFSSGTDYAMIMVDPAGPNTAPSLMPGGSIAAIDEDIPDASNQGQTIAEIVGATITDPDFGAQEGIAVIYADNGYGAWEYTIDDGANWTPFSGLSQSSATLLADNSESRVRFSPTQDFNTEMDPPPPLPFIEYRAWDQTSGSNGDTGVDVSFGHNGGETAFSSETAFAEIVVNAVNDAPTIMGGGGMPWNIEQDIPDASNQGRTVEELFGMDMMDVDDSLPMGNVGVAVVGAENANGDWQYSLAGDGSDWAAFGSVSDLNAVLLSPTAKIRFVTDHGWSGDAQITVRAWDQTSGLPGDTGVDVSTNGGTTAFSSATGNAMIMVDPSANTSPDLMGNGALTGIDEDTVVNPGDTVSAIIAGTWTDIDGNNVGIALWGDNDVGGSWQYSTNGGGSWLNVADLTPGLSETEALLLGENALIRFVPDGDWYGTAQIDYYAWDQSSSLIEGDRVDVSNPAARGGSSPFSFNNAVALVTVTAVNDDPDAIDDSYSTDEETVLNVPANGVLSNDTDVDGPGPLTVSGVDLTGTLGLVTWNADGSFSYDPDGQFESLEVGQSTTDSWSYTVSDGNGGEDTATVIVTIDGMNEPPIASINGGSGKLDPTFSEDGTITTEYGTIMDYGYSVAVQSDDKIVVAGTFYNGSDLDFAVARLNDDGTLDTSFGADGIVITDILYDSENANSVAVQSDGKIVVAGTTYNGSDTDFAVVRYNSDGSLDTSFDSDGAATADIGGSHDYGQSVAIQSDGKIVVAGSADNGSDSDFAIARFNTDGSLDTSFDSDGVVTTAIGGSHDYGFSVAIQSDGKILVGGYADNGSDHDFAIARFNIDGSLDTSFDTDGRVTTDFLSGSDSAFSLAVQSDGKILLGGQASNGSNPDFAIARYNSDGSLDTSFDTDGRVTTDFSSGYDNGNSLVVQSDGRIVMVGSADNGSDYDVAIARYNANGTLDTSFGGVGTVATDFGYGYDYGYSVALQSHGKIVVVGEAYNGSTSGLALLRYAPTLDYTEGDGAVVICNDVSIADIDSANLESATIQITGNYQSSEDSLALDVGYVPPAGVSESWNSLNGTLTITGSATPAEYETILEHVTYSNNSSAPYTDPRGITWTVNDGTDDSLAQIGVITVTDLVNGAPTGISLDSSLVNVDDPAGTTIGTFTTTDPDAGDTHMYSLVAGTGDADNTAFTIVGDELQTIDLFDYSSQDTYSIRVQTDDGNGGTYEEVFTIEAVQTVGGTDYFLVHMSGTSYTAGSRNEIIYGTSGDDLIDASGQNYQYIVYGGDGDDTITGGNLADTLYGEGGGDSIDGGPGPDSLYAHTDATWNTTYEEIIYGNSGDDFIVGTDGPDLLSGGDGSDTIDGKAGEDCVSQFDGIYRDGTLQVRPVDFDATEWQWEYWNTGTSTWEDFVFGHLRLETGTALTTEEWNSVATTWEIVNATVWFKDDSYPNSGPMGDGWNYLADFDPDLYDGDGYNGEPVSISSIQIQYALGAEPFTVDPPPDPDYKVAYQYTVTGDWSGSTLVQWEMEDATMDPSSLEVLFVADDAENLTRDFISTVRYMNDYGEYRSNPYDWNFEEPNIEFDNMVRDDVLVVFYDSNQFDLELWAYQAQLVSYAGGTFGQQTDIDLIGIEQHGNTDHLWIGNDAISSLSHGTFVDGDIRWNYQEQYVVDAFTEMSEVLGANAQFQVWECSVAGTGDVLDTGAASMLSGIASYTGATVYASTDLTIWGTIWQGNYDGVTDGDWTLEYATNGDASSIILPWNYRALNLNWEEH